MSVKRIFTGRRMLAHVRDLHATDDALRRVVDDHVPAHGLVVGLRVRDRRARGLARDANVA